ncbi:hypothetical protein ARMSODRAFT_539683 [Armillaria solidipes]|uniref:Uncharacterized protein n=1 Tax=Armillaria solidipes TaxID=1076256 RepID=A0A2H3B8G2_9AGAR|nr:hypothetical protein ARMSODRAFT_539683 [Armillaria solidipes]
MIPSPPALASHPAPAVFSSPTMQNTPVFHAPPGPICLNSNCSLPRPHHPSCRSTPRRCTGHFESRVYCQMAPKQWRPRCWCALLVLIVTVLSLKQDARILGLVIGTSRISK